MRPHALTAASRTAAVGPDEHRWTRIGAEPVTLSGAGGRLACYWRDGNGPVAICAHGNASHAGIWIELLARLRTPFLALDMRGHGHSDWPPPTRYATADYAGDLADAAATLGGR